MKNKMLLLILALCLGSVIGTGCSGESKKGDPVKAGDYATEPGAGKKTTP